MSFRSGSRIILLIKSMIKSITKPMIKSTTLNAPITLNRPMLFELYIALTTIGINNVPQKQLSVIRNKISYKIENDRDVEELGGSIGEEILYVDNIHQPFQNLANIILTSQDIEAASNDKPKDELIVFPNERNLCGDEIVYALQKYGYFKLRLSQDERDIVLEAFKTMKEFCQNLSTKKNKFIQPSIGNMQPQFGYRSTKLNKEYFVCRNVHDNLKQSLQFPNKHFEDAMMKWYHMIGRISQTLMKSILVDGLKYNENQVDQLLDGTLDPAETLDTFGFSSMTEIFRYDCTSTSCSENGYRIPCGDHRDVSLLTIIPKCMGPPGLQVFNWQGFWQAVENQSTDLDCVVIAGELLHRLSAGEISPTSHRVVVPLSTLEKDQDIARYSCPFEILLRPLYEIDCCKLIGENINIKISDTFQTVETSQDYISNTSKNLISVNK